MLEKRKSNTQRLAESFLPFVSSVLGEDYACGDCNWGEELVDWGKEGVYEFVFYNANETTRFSNPHSIILTFVQNNVDDWVNEEKLPFSEIIVEQIKRCIAALYYSSISSKKAELMVRKDERKPQITITPVPEEFQENGGNFNYQFPIDDVSSDRTTIFEFQVKSKFTISMFYQLLQQKEIKESKIQNISPTITSQFHNKPRPRGYSQLSTDENFSSASFLDINRKRSLFSHKDSILLLKDESELDQPMYDENGIMIESEIINSNPMNSKISRKVTFEEKEGEIGGFFKTSREELRSEFLDLVDFVNSM